MPIYPYEKGGKEHWYYAFEVKDRKGNRKTIKKRGFTGRTAAREAERVARVNWDKGQYVDPSKITFGEYIKKWLEHKQDISDETRYTNEGHLENHIIPSLGSIPLQKITVTDLKDFIQELQNKKVKDKPIAEGTVKKIFNLVQTCFTTAMIEEAILKNPFDLLENSQKPKVGKAKIDYWKKEEVKSFFTQLELLNRRDKILFVLAIYTGMRRGEITGLRWQDIDFDNSIISIQQTLKPQRKIKDGGKNSNATRSITMSPVVMNELKKHRAAMIKERWGAQERYKDQSELEQVQNNYAKLDLVICQTNGEPINVSNFTRNWDRLLNRMEIRRIKFHDLRHTCASLHLSAGTHPKIVQELLGHSSIKITLDTYSHMLPNMQEDAVKALDELLN